MGSFKIVNVQGVKFYALFSKNSINKVLSAITSMSYACYNEGRKSLNAIYLDSPNNLLTSAGIVLSKVIEDGKAYFKVEKEEYFADKKVIIPKERKIFVHPIGVKDVASDHSLFLSNGITSMFFTKFHIDFENVFKTVQPKLEIESNKNIFKILSGKGFKAEMIYENVFVRNNETKRKTKMLMLNIKQTSGIGKEEFKKFIVNLEKLCKEMMPTRESRYEMAKRMTAEIVKK